MVRHIGTIVCRKQCGEDDPDPSGSPIRLFLKNRFVVIHNFLLRGIYIRGNLLLISFIRFYKVSVSTSVVNFIIA